MRRRRNSVVLFPPSTAWSRQETQAIALYKAPDEIEVMRALKRTLDPNNILNPGKLLPEDQGGGGPSGADLQQRHLEDERLIGRITPPAPASP
jgi:hypothetical protein